MKILYFLIPVAFIFVVIFFWGIVWTVRNEQYEDMDGPAHRILMDDDDPMVPPEARQHKK